MKSMKIILLCDTFWLVLSEQFISFRVVVMAFKYYINVVGSISNGV